MLSATHSSRSDATAILDYPSARRSARLAPVWYRWDGQTVRMFAYETGGKLEAPRERPARDCTCRKPPRTKSEKWVSFDGSITVHDEGGIEMAERVFDRYYPGPR